MDDKEFELEHIKLHLGVEKWMAIKDVVVLSLKLATAILCVFIVMYYLYLMSSQNPEAIKAISMVVASIKLNQIILYITTAGAVSYGYLERRGKKRAISQVSELRAELEQRDPYRGSSKLTKTGDTPKPKRKKTKMISGES
ncbi:hypothetical protein ACF8D3_13505 [Acinetobacter sp. YQ_14]|uniref:hypothetical protein n=1 Tax=Acinetobacter sp. YQ_14 TaxID=3367236 RepID=UPI00370B1780